MPPAGGFRGSRVYTSVRSGRLGRCPCVCVIRPAPALRGAAGLAILSHWGVDEASAGFRPAVQGTRGWEGPRTRPLALRFWSRTIPHLTVAHLLAPTGPCCPMRSGGPNASAPVALCAPQGRPSGGPCPILSWETTCPAVFSLYQQRLHPQIPASALTNVLASGPTFLPQQSCGLRLQNTSRESVQSLVPTVAALPPTWVTAPGGLPARTHALRSRLSSLARALVPLCVTPGVFPVTPSRNPAHGPAPGPSHGPAPAASLLSTRLSWLRPLWPCCQAPTAKPLLPTPLSPNVTAGLEPSPQCLLNGGPPGRPPEPPCTPECPSVLCPLPLGLCDLSVPPC